MFNIGLFLVFMKAKYRINGFKNFKNEMFFLFFVSVLLHSGFVF